MKGVDEEVNFLIDLLTNNKQYVADEKVYDTDSYEGRGGKSNPGDLDYEV